MSLLLIFIIYFILDDLIERKYFFKLSKHFDVSFAAPFLCTNISFTGQHIAVLLISCDNHSIIESTVDNLDDW